MTDLLKLRLRSLPTLVPNAHFNLRTGLLPFRSAHILFAPPQLRAVRQLENTALEGFLDLCGFGGGCERGVVRCAEERSM